MSIIILTTILSLCYLIMGVGFYFLSKPKIVAKITPFVFIAVILTFPVGLIIFGVGYFLWEMTHDTLPH